MKVITSVAFILLSTLIMDLSRAYAASGIELTMAAQEEIITLNDHGEQVVSLVEPTAVVPGDMIVYITKYHNTGNSTAENVVITTPIPKDTAYVGGSAVREQTTVTYSVDGGKHYDSPENLAIIGEDGIKHPATANDFTHIRWTLKSVAQDGQGSVSFHAKVR